MSEIWKPCLGFEEWYEVSDYPNFRSWRNTRGNRRKEPNYGKIWLNTHDNYYYVSFNVNGLKVKKISVVVCEAFRGPRPSKKHDACHNDGDKSNNRLSNLEWKLDTENEADKKLHGTDPSGTRNGHHKLEDAGVLQIRALAGKVRQQDLADRFGVTQSVISEIVNRKSWTHL